MTIESELARIGDLLEKLLAAESSKSESSTTTRKTRTKAASASTDTAPATTSSTSDAPTPPASPSAEEAPEEKPIGAGTLPASKEPTSTTPSVDEVRAALTQCQARNGGALDKPRAILLKYAKTGTLGSLAEADRAKVIAECNAG